MIKKYKNTIYKLLEEDTLGVERFEVEETKIKGIDTFTIFLRNSPLKFSIQSSPDDYNFFTYRYTKFNLLFEESGVIPTKGYFRFSKVLEDFDWFLQHVVEPYLAEKDEPDYWQINNRVELYTVVNHDFNVGFFTTEEKTAIRVILEKLGPVIKLELNIGTFEQSIVNSRLDYLISSLDKLNKFDWNSVFVSSIIGIITTLSLDATMGKKLFDLLKEAFSSAYLR
ncbi:MAG: hypothetical protein IPP32_02950 [Bacteroidetes bacterium]|nr:hypothetical protein [Bacteroidota bacterium]